MDNRKDKRAPKARSAAVRKSMLSNRAKDTGPELTVRRALSAKGVRGYRLNWKKAPGRPDVCFNKKKIAVFVHGCFWHRCPDCKLPIPKSNRKFWKCKFTKNRNRDRKKRTTLINQGWRVIEVWECKIKDNVEKAIYPILKRLAKTHETI